MLKGKDAVIFDLDGTLTDSMTVWTDIDKRFFRERGMVMPADLQKQIEGLSFHETAEYFVANFPLKETVPGLKQIWIDMAIEEYSKNVYFKPGAEDFLCYLRDRGYKMAIASSNSRVLVEAFLKARSADDFFAVTTTSEESQKGKPAPDVYLITAENLEVSPERCLVFEDIPAGIMAGKNAGMEVAAVEDGYSVSWREEKKRLADYYVYDYRELLEELAAAETAVS